MPIDCFYSLLKKWTIAEAGLSLNFHQTRRTGALNRIVEIGTSENLPVSAEEVREHLGSLDDGATRQWLIKARGGL